MHLFLAVSSGPVLGLHSAVVAEVSDFFETNRGAEQQSRSWTFCCVAGGSVSVYHCCCRIVLSRMRPNFKNGPESLVFLVGVVEACFGCGLASWLRIGASTTTCFWPWCVACDRLCVPLVLSSGEGFKFHVFHDLDLVVWRQLLKLPNDIWNVILDVFALIGDADPIQVVFCIRFDACSRS